MKATEILRQMAAVAEAQHYAGRIERAKLESESLPIPDGAYVDWTCSYEFVYVGYSADSGCVVSFGDTKKVSTLRPLSNAGIEQIWFSLSAQFDYIERIDLDISYPCCRLCWADWLPF